jgi:alkanesulfonate monooxygenase SsuD/methylene tetrahydromethanopterin reductase-like flavin-dependent oxidoreductase (luciferase family)
MLQQNYPRHPVSDLLTFDTRCIQALSPGFTTLWMEDHLQWETTVALECYTTLCYFAAQYPQFKVGSLVLCQFYRNPALLAKMAATLQVLSSGRFILGIGAGWKDDEYISYGYPLPFPSPATREEQLEEYIQVLRAMWTSVPATFEGQYYCIRDAYCEPQPSPTIPIVIGGGGEKRTLALVARYADWWNFNSCTVEEYAHKLAILKEHCERIGRDPSEIKLSYLSTASVSDDPSRVQRHPTKHFIAGSTEEVIREIERFHEIGVTHCMFRFLDVETVEHFAEKVVPHFR